MKLRHYIIFSPILIVLLLMGSGCNYFVGDENAQRIRQIREELYQESRHHRVAVGQATHTFAGSGFRQSVKERFEEDLPITLGKNIGFEYSLHHLWGWLTDVTHYAFAIDGAKGDRLSMSHTNISTNANFYLWRLYGSELALGGGLGVQFLQRELTDTSGSQSDSFNKLLYQFHAQYNQVFTKGFALSYILRVIHVEDYHFDNPSNDKINVVSRDKVVYQSGGAEAIVVFYFPFYTKPHD